MDNVINFRVFSNVLNFSTSESTDYIKQMNELTTKLRSVKIGSPEYQKINDKIEKLKSEKGPLTRTGKSNRTLSKNERKLMKAEYAQSTGNGNDKRLSNAIDNVRADVENKLDNTDDKLESRKLKSKLQDLDNKSSKVENRQANENLNKDSMLNKYNDALLTRQDKKDIARANKQVGKLQNQADNLINRKHELEKGSGLINKAKLALTERELDKTQDKLDDANDIIKSNDAATLKGKFNLGKKALASMKDSSRSGKKVRGKLLHQAADDIKNKLGVSESTGKLIDKSVNKFNNKLDKRLKHNQKIANQGGPRIQYVPAKSMFKSLANWNKWKPLNP